MQTVQETWHVELFSIILSMSVTISPMEFFHSQLEFLFMQQ